MDCKEIWKVIRQHTKLCLTESSTIDEFLASLREIVENEVDLMKKESSSPDCLNKIETCSSGESLEEDEFIS